MMRIYKKEFFYGRRPIWVPLTEDGRPVEAADVEAAKAIVAALRGGVYRLRSGEYAAPDYGIRGPDGRIHWVDP